VLNFNKEAISKICYVRFISLVIICTYEGIFTNAEIMQTTHKRYHRLPSRSASRAPGFSFSYLAAMSYTTNPHLCSPPRSFCVQGLCRSGRNQSKGDRPIVSFHPSIMVPDQGCWNCMVCMTTNISPVLPRTVRSTGQSSSLSLLTSPSEDVGGVCDIGGPVGMVVTRKAMLWMPPLCIASTDV
jgi:hypothetical protein